MTTEVCEQAGRSGRTELQDLGMILETPNLRTQGPCISFEGQGWESEVTEDSSWPCGVPCAYPPPGRCSRCPHAALASAPPTRPALEGPHTQQSRGLLPNSSVMSGYLLFTFLEAMLKQIKFILIMYLI